MTSKNQAAILIAEDDKSMSKALELKLKKSGFNVSVAYDGEEAIKKISESKFSLILLDLIMPKLDGFSVLEEIKAKKISSKVIVTSNLSQEEDVKRAKELGAVDYLVKSDTTIKEIVEKVSSLV